MPRQTPRRLLITSTLIIFDLYFITNFARSLAFILVFPLSLGIYQRVESFQTVVDLVADRHHLQERLEVGVQLDALAFFFLQHWETLSQLIQHALLAQDVRLD